MLPSGKEGVNEQRGAHGKSSATDINYIGVADNKGEKRGKIED